jgi:hypothetical protein
LVHKVVYLACVLSSLSVLSSSVSSVRATLDVVLGPAAAAGEGAARAAGAADTASRASLGRFLAGSKRTRVPQTGPVVGPAEAAAGHTHTPRAGGSLLPQPPPPPPAEAAGVGPDRGHGSRAATPEAAYLERAALPPPTLPERKGSRRNRFLAHFHQHTNTHQWKK